MDSKKHNHPIQMPRTNTAEQKRPTPGCRAIKGIEFYSNAIGSNTEYSCHEYNLPSEYSLNKDPEPAEFDYLELE